ncbi:MAG: segregation/condensation protein A [Oscillospiraceae bacterium]|nr:segregation/condensation protein A [Oscillospiraceae bacterium]
MEKIEYKLEIFEGPLDLLLHLIEKNKIDIFDINISQILEQYLDYIYVMEQADLYIASEFIDMTSRLLYIKSRMLLPKKEGEPDPREELVKILLDYSEIKIIAEYLGRQFDIYKNRYEKPEDTSIFNDAEISEIDEMSVINPEILSLIFLRLAEKKNLPPPLESVRILTVKKPVTMAEKIISIIRRLYKTGSEDFFGLLNNHNDTGEIIAVFAAILELLKTNRIIITGEDLLECRFVLNREKKTV